MAVETRIPRTVPGTDFLIEWRDDADGRAHLVEREGYHDGCHAHAALLIAQALGKEVYWVQGGIEVSTRHGTEVRQLTDYYKKASANGRA